MNDALRQDFRAWFDAKVAEDAEEGFADFAHYGGYSGYDSLREILAVADLLRNGDAPFGMLHRMVIGTSSDADGSVEGYDLGIDLDYRTFGGQFYLTRFVDWRGTTTDRSATGVEAAWGYLEALVENWDRLVNAASAISAAVALSPEVVRAQIEA